jgi:MlaD protein
MRTLEGSDRVRKGLMGILVLLLVTGVGQSFASVPMIFASPTYYAQFKDAGGIKPGDKVRVAGVSVGQVRTLEIQGDHILVGFSVTGLQIGNNSRASIRTDTILGRKDIEIEPRGTQILKANDVLPLGQTTTPYQIYDAFFDVTKAASGWNIDTVKQSLNVLADTIDQTYPTCPTRSGGSSGSPTRSASVTSRSISCWPAPTRSPGSSATAASRSTRFWLTPRRCSPRSTNAARRSRICCNGCRRSPSR